MGRIWVVMNAQVPEEREQEMQNRGEASFGILRETLVGKQLGLADVIGKGNYDTGLLLIWLCKSLQNPLTIWRHPDLESEQV